MGDRFEIEFDLATNRALDRGGRDYVDTLLHFSWPNEDLRTPALPERVGDELDASWTDASTLELTLVSTAPGEAEWPVLVLLKGALQVRNDALEVAQILDENIVGMHPTDSAYSSAA